MGKILNIIYILRTNRRESCLFMNGVTMVTASAEVVRPTFIMVNSLPELEYRQGALVPAGPVIVVIPGRLKTKVR